MKKMLLCFSGDCRGGNRTTNPYNPEPTRTSSYFHGRFSG